jgi:hypothetical protein
MKKDQGKKNKNSNNKGAKGANDQRWKRVESMQHIINSSCLVEHPRDGTGLGSSKYNM